MFNKNNTDYDNFLNNYHKFSWKFARYSIEYDNYIEEYNLLKKNILEEYTNYYLDNKYSYKKYVELAHYYIDYSQRLNKFITLNDDIKNNKKHYSIEYDLYYKYYTNNL